MKCQFSKHSRTHHIQPYKSSDPFSLIHSDVCGPSRIKNINSTRWFVLFVDDHTHLTCLFLMKEKLEIGIIFQRFNTIIQTQLQTKILVLKIDNARAYFGSILREYLSKQGIIHQSSCVDTSQQNSVAERLLGLLCSPQMSLNFWGEAVLTVTYLITWMPS